MRRVRSSRLRSFLLQLAPFFHIVAFVPIVGGAIYFLAVVPSVPTITSISATVESMSFDVVVPEMAQLPLRGFAIYFEAPLAAGGLGFATSATAAPETRTLCGEGLLVPNSGTRITFKRFGMGSTSIELSRRDGAPVGSFAEASEALPADLRQSSWVRLDARDAPGEHRDCEGTAMARLPIYGVGDIGAEIKPASNGAEPTYGALLEGTVDVFAHVVDLPLLGGDPRRIYPARPNAINLPAGSRITEALGPNEVRKPWVGFAMANPRGVGLDVRVTTDAKDIAIVRPGLGLTPEILSLGLLTQLGNDPLLVRVQLLAAVLFAVLKFLEKASASLVAYRDRRVRVSTRPAE